MNQGKETERKGVEDKKVGKLERMEKYREKLKLRIKK